MISLRVLGVLMVIWLVLAQGCMTFRMPDADAKKKFADKGVELVTSNIIVNKRKIHYAKTGSDTLPTLFFVHGTPGSWDAFQGYMMDTSLLKRYRMVSIDRPGFGYSDFGKAVHLDAQSVLLAPLFQAMKNGKPMFLVGHSLGGPMIIKLAADNPGVFSALVLLAGSIDPAEEKPERWRPVLYKTPLKYFVPGAFRPSNEELWYLKRDLVELKDDFKKINIPVHFVHGLLDTWVPPGNVAYGAKMLVNAPKIDSLMLPGANHFIPWTRYEQIRQVLLNLGM